MLLNFFREEEDGYGLDLGSVLRRDNTIISGGWGWVGGERWVGLKDSSSKGLKAHKMGGQTLVRYLQPSTRSGAVAYKRTTT